MKKRGPRRRKRPIAVSLTSFVSLGVAIFHIYHGLNHLLETESFTSGYFLSSMIQALLFILLFWRSVIELTLSLFALFIIFNFFRLHRWSWVALVLWVTVNILVDLMTYFYAQANFVSMLVNVTVAFSIMQNDVQVIFGIRKGEEGHELAF